MNFKCYTVKMEAGETTRGLFSLFPTDLRFINRNLLCTSDSPWIYRLVRRMRLFFWTKNMSVCLGFSFALSSEWLGRWLNILFVFVALFFNRENNLFINLWCYAFLFHLFFWEWLTVDLFCQNKFKTCSKFQTQTPLTFLKMSVCWWSNENHLGHSCPWIIPVRPDTETERIVVLWIRPLVQYK